MEESRKNRSQHTFLSQQHLSRRVPRENHCCYSLRLLKNENQVEDFQPVVHQMLGLEASGRVFPNMEPMELLAVHFHTHHHLYPVNMLWLSCSPQTVQGRSKHLLKLSSSTPWAPSNSFEHTCLHLKCNIQ